jgi:hypothetical protein
MESVQVEPINYNGVWGEVNSGVQGHSPWSGAKHPDAESMSTFEKHNLGMIL